jgi:hypothetical protein
LDISILAQTAFEAHRHASGNLDAQWESTNQGEKEAWEHVAGQAILQLDRDDVECVTALALAHDMYDAFKGAYSILSRSWEELSWEEKICWEAVGRHLFNMIDSDGIINMGEHEPRWRGWAETQLAKRILV